MKVKAAAMQAFPFIEPNADDAIKAYHPGMTMRDEFAKAAMLAMLTHYEPSTSFDEEEVKDPEGMPSLIAKDAYIMADAMLEARK